MRKSTKTLILRRFLFALIILLAHILQNSRGVFPSIFGIHANLLLPLTVCIGMFEREVAGAFLGLFAGVLWDTVSGLGDGYNALFLMLASALCGLLITLVMRNNLMTALLLSAGTCLVYAILYVVFFVLAEGVDSSGYLLLRYYLPNALYSFIFTPIWYLLVRSVMRKTKLD